MFRVAEQGVAYVSLADLDPAAYAPYDDPRDFIQTWTDRIWIARGVGAIADLYPPEVKVHTAYGETYSTAVTTANSLQKMVAFPNRGGGHDDVIWEPRGRTGFVSFHRVFNNATHGGTWTYGPPTGKQWMNRSVAHCLVRDGKIIEEWVVRDEYAVLEHLGLDPLQVATELAERSPVLGGKIDLGGGAFAGRFPDPVVEGISGRRPAAHEAECRWLAGMFEECWNGRLFDRLANYLADTVVCQTVRLRRVMQLAPYQLELMSLLSPFPDATFEIRDIAAHLSPDLGLRIGVIWLLRGSYSGAPVFGPTNNAPIAVLGASAFELRRGRIVREWRIYDEIAMLAQIVAHAKRQA
jgi:predicted ester cyclase